MKKKISQYKIYILATLAVVIFAFYLSPQSSCADGLVPCKNDCNFCYLLVGFSNIFQWLGGSLLITATVFGIVVGGLSYIIAGVFPKALNFAQQALTGSLRGFAFALCGWLIVNAVMNIAGWKGGNWWQYDCTGKGNSNTSQCDLKNKKLDSIVIQCAEQTKTLAENGAGFYVALDTLSGDDKGKTKQLKAIGKYSCDGTTSEEDITSQVEWKASDETQIKVAKGLVQAVTTSLGSSGNIPYVEAKFQEKNSNQAKVYINSCPNTTTADTETENKLSFSENNLKIPKAHAQTASPTSANCKSCGETSTCHFIYGNENATRKLILIRGWQRCLSELNTPENTAFGGNPCKNPEWWDKSSQSDYQLFKKTVDLMKTDIDYAPNGSQEFSVYMSDLVADEDPNCPPKKDFEMYGYVCKGNSGRAYNWQGYASFCLGSYTKGTMAHEIIGHGFALLDDEYTETGKTFSEGLPHFNCTASSSIPTKWGTSVSWDGCSLESRFYRPSYNSIMNASYSSPLTNSQGFQSVDEEIISKTYKDPQYKDPNGLIKWYEVFQ